jgi:tRNA nucleotidyltransferase (CCA-adding enzyme)
MTIQLPQKVNTIIGELKKHGFDAYAVGGCVRDSVLGREPQDWDITTSAKPQQVKEIFHRTVDTGIQHGTVTVLLDKEGFEVTTYRIDGEYEDARHPKDVIFTSNLLEDLKRRDFTINAMAYNEEAGLVDAFDGLGDLKRHVIRCVGDATERFTEDALRMLRAVRFAAQLGFDIEEDTGEAIRHLAPNLSKISAERIQVELVKLVTSPHPERMKTVYDMGIADVILPEFSVMMQTTQNNPHHIYTVGEHTIHSMESIRADKVLRLTMLFHDVAKPACRTEDENGIHHFHGHPKVGAEMTKKILRRLKFDNETIRRVCALVSAHDDRPPLTGKTIRRAIYRNGVDQYPALFEVKRADILAQSSFFQQKKLDYVDQYEQMYQQICEKEQCLSLKDLAVTGSDLIAAGMKPGKEIGQVLNRMLEAVLEEPEWNQKEILLEKYRQGIF